MTTFPQVLSGLLRARRRPPARHLLRRRDRRAHRALGHDVRELGGQGRLAARRRARRRARQPAARRPARALARAGRARRRVGGRARGGVGAARRRGGHRSRRRRPLGGGGRRHPGRRDCAAAAGRPVRRDPPARRPRPRGRGLVAARRVRRVAGAPADDDAARARADPAQLWRAAAVGSHLTDGGRLLSEASPASPSGLASFTEPLARSGSMVLVAHASEERREQIAADERVTARFDPGQPARS